jgi:hypothetical protein
MNWVSNIINLFCDVYCVSDMEFAKIHGELLRRLINGCGAESILIESQSLPIDIDCWSLCAWEGPQPRLDG